MANVYVSLFGFFVANSKGSNGVLPDGRRERRSTRGIVQRLYEKTDLRHQDYDRFRYALDELIASGIDGVHLEVLDRSYYEYDSPFGLRITSQIAEFCTILAGNKDFPIDAHLLVEQPVLKIDCYKDAKASRITLPYRAFSGRPDDISKVLSKIKTTEPVTKAGISLVEGEVRKTGFDPGVLDEADFVTVVCSGPGNDIPPILPGAYSALRTLAKYKEERGVSYELIAEGGINSITIANDLRSSGAESFIMGASLFKSADLSYAVKRLKQVLTGDGSREISGPSLQAQSS